jgi:hypothetical protein
VSGAEDSKGDVVGIARGDAGAVGASNEAQVVDACYQGADECEIDESDEAGVCLATVVAKQCADGPGRPEDRDDK